MKLLAACSVVNPRPSKIVLLGYLVDGTAVFSAHRQNDTGPRLRQLPGGAWSMLYLQPQALNTLEDFASALFGIEFSGLPERHSRNSARLNPLLVGIAAVVCWEVQFNKIASLYRKMERLHSLLNHTAEYPFSVWQAGYNSFVEL